MNNLTSEQIQAILDGAPEGFTHIDLDDDEYEVYGDRTRSLSDLGEIITLRQEVERLKSEVESKNHDIIEAVKKARTQWAREDVEAIKNRWAK